MRERLFTLIAALAVMLAMVIGGDVHAPDAKAQGGGSWYREVTFDSANVVSADERGAVAADLGEATLAAFQTVCTEDSGTATLDIAVQRSIDGGTTWANVTTFTQLSATGGQTVIYADVRASSAQMIGDRLSINYDITGTGQYTCSVYGAFEA